MMLDNRQIVIPDGVFISLESAPAYSTGAFFTSLAHDGFLETAGDQGVKHKGDKPTRTCDTRPCDRILI